MNKAFTLIELSIVMIILSLIVAMVMGGQSLVHSSKIQSIILDTRKIEVAVATFLYSYEYYPGDLPNAEEYWPGLTTNGDGDGRIGTIFALNHNMPEWQKFMTNSGAEGDQAWDQLKLAGLLVGKQIPDVTSILLGSKSNDWGYDIATSLIYDKEVTAIRVGCGLESCRNFGYTINGAITTPDARAIDKKIDDGRSDGGNLFAKNDWAPFRPEITNCISVTSIVPGSIWGDPLTSDYILSNETKSCKLILIIP